MPIRQDVISAEDLRRDIDGFQIECLVVTKACAYLKNLLLLAVSLLTYLCLL